MTAQGRLNPGELAISFALIALGAFAIYETGGIAETQGYAQIGPRLFPYLVGAGLTLCGAWLGWQALTGGWRQVPLDAGHDRPDWMAFGVISAGVILHMIVIGWAGFVIAGVLLFVLVARGFGSRRPARDAVIALALAVAVYLLFTKAMGLNLPATPFIG